MTDYVKELRPSGGHYSTVDAWQTAHGGASGKDLVTQGDSVTLEFYKGDYTSIGDGGGVDFIHEHVTITGWTCGNPRAGSSNYITFVAPESERHDGTPGTGIRWKESTNYTFALRPHSNSDVVVEGLEFFCDRTSNGGGLVQFSSTTAGGWFDSCVFEVNGIGTCIDNSGRHSGGDNEIAINCIFINRNTTKGGSAVVFAGYSYGSVYNCSGYNLTRLIYWPGPVYVDCDVNSCVAFDCTNWYSSTGTNNIGSNTGYNAGESTATLPPDNVGSSNVTTITSSDFIGANTTDKDLHGTPDNDMIGNGADNSSIFTNDIDGDTRSAWDIGADEYISSGTTFIIRATWF